MRLLCPFCQKTIEIADNEAGKVADCPECHQKFTAPQLYSPPAPTPAEPATYNLSTPQPVSSPVAPPVTPAPSLETTSAYTPPAPPSVPAGTTKSWTLVLSTSWIRWVPPISLSLILLLTLFSWSGLYPAGYSAYTQNAWESLFAAIDEDPVSERFLKIGANLKEKVKTTWYLLPYLVFIIPTTALAWICFRGEEPGFKLPVVVESYWKYRYLALAALTVFLFLMLFAQWSSGFGLQRAVKAIVISDPEIEKLHSDTPTPEEKQKYEMAVASRIAMYHPRTTFWFKMVMILQFLATVSSVLAIYHIKRPRKVPARLTFEW
jgi:hypothetical protein